MINEPHIARDYWNQILFSASWHILLTVKTTEQPRSAENITLFNEVLYFTSWFKCIAAVKKSPFDVQQREQFNNITDSVHLLIPVNRDSEKVRLMPVLHWAE